MKRQSLVYPHKAVAVKPPYPETTDGKIASETTADLGNIHSFLTSIFITDKENLTLFGLLMRIEIELHGRPEAKKYLDAMKELFQKTA